MHRSLSLLVVLVLAVCSSAEDCPQRKGYAAFNTASGAPGHLNIPMTPGLPTGQNFDTHTVSFRARLNIPTSAEQILFTAFFKTDSDVSNKCVMSLTSAGLAYSCPGQTVSTSFTPVGWHVIVASRSSSSISIAVDSNPISTQAANGTSTLRFFDMIELGQAFNGDINELAVFYKLLTSSECADVKNFAHSAAIYSDSKLNVYIPFYSFDFTNVAPGLYKGGAASFSNSSTYTYLGIVGSADTYCSASENTLLDASGNVCRYRKELNKFFDYPTLVTDANANQWTWSIRSGFTAFTYRVQIKVPKHLVIKYAAPQYNLTDLLPNWGNTLHTFLTPTDDEITDPFCTAWFHPMPYMWGERDPCSMVITYFTLLYGKLTRTCGFQSSQAGVAPLAGASADEVGVFGKAKLTFYDLAVSNCHAHNPANTPDCAQPISETFIFPFATYFKSFVTTLPKPVTVYDEATALSVTTSQSTTSAELDLTGEAVKYSSIVVKGHFKTYVNWPYTLSLHAYSNVDTSSDTTISIVPSAGPTGYCGGNQSVGFTGTCVQEYDITLTAGPQTLALPTAGLKFDTTISLTMHVTVTNKAANDYNLAPFTISLTSGDLTPSVTEHITDVSARLNSCHEPLTPSNDFVCPTGPNKLAATKFVTSSRQVPPQSATQTAYFAVVPNRVSKGTLQSCQLLSVIAFPTGSTDDGQKLTIYSKQNAESSWGVEVLSDSDYPYAGNAANDIWLADPVNVNGAHLDYNVLNPSHIPACAFNFQVLKEYFTTVSTGSTSWSIQAKVFLKFFGETVIPQGGRLKLTGKVQTFAATVGQDTSGKTAAEVVLSVAAPAGEKTASAIPSPSGGGGTYYSTNCADKFPATTFIGSCVGIGVGGCLLGAAVAWAMWSAGSKHSSNNYNQQRMGNIQMSDTSGAMMEKHLAVGPTSSNAGHV